jgi:hypothetical protein
VFPKRAESSDCLSGNIPSELVDSRPVSVRHIAVGVPIISNLNRQQLCGDQTMNRRVFCDSREHEPHVCIRPAVVRMATTVVEPMAKRCVPDEIHSDFQLEASGRGHGIDGGAAVLIARRSPQVHFDQTIRSPSTKCSIRRNWIR